MTVAELVYRLLTCGADARTEVRFCYYNTFMEVDTGVYEVELGKAEDGEMVVKVR